MSFFFFLLPYKTTKTTSFPCRIFCSVYFFLTTLFLLDRCIFAVISTIYGCAKCGMGKIAATSSVVCLDCEIGKYQPLNIATTNACSACAAGQFAASGSAAACSICTEGQFQDLNVAVEYSCTCCCCCCCCCWNIAWIIVVVATFVRWILTFLPFHFFI